MASKDLKQALGDKEMLIFGNNQWLKVDEKTVLNPD